MAGVDKFDATRALEQEFGVLMRRLRLVMGERAKLVHPDVNAAGYAMLMALTMQDHRASELADQFLLDKGAVSRIVRQLEDLGLVKRRPDPDDGRAQKLQLTPVGRARLDEVAEQSRSTFHQRIEDWSAQELQDLVLALRRYNEAIS